MTAPATFVCIKGGNDTYWRMSAPAKAIGAKEIDIPEEGGYFSVVYPNDDTVFPWTATFRLVSGEVVEIKNLDDWNDVTKRGVVVSESWSGYPTVEGAVVWTRPDLMRATHAKSMRKNGTRTLAEVDDNYFCPADQNIFLKGTRFDEKGRMEHAKAMASMDGIVTSTPWLRDRYFRELKKRFSRSAVPEMFVCRNNIAAEDWPEIPEHDGPVRVGWMGSPSHVWDVEIAWAAFMHARNLGAETVMVGHDPTSVDTDDAMPGAARSKAKTDAWKKVGLKVIPWVDPGQFRRGALPFDIGLAPLLSNDFTQGKSDVKFLEYTVSGAATIAQNMSVYNNTIIHGETGLLAGSAQEFLELTELLIRDEKLRRRLVQNAQQYVREERGIKQLREEWLAAVA